MTWPRSLKFIAEPQLKPCAFTSKVSALSTTPVFQAGYKIPASTLHVWHPKIFIPISDLIVPVLPCLLSSSLTYLEPGILSSSGFLSLSWAHVYDNSPFHSPCCSGLIHHLKKSACRWRNLLSRGPYADLRYMCYSHARRWAWERTKPLFSVVSRVWPHMTAELVFFFFSKNEVAGQGGLRALAGLWIINTSKL